MTENILHSKIYGAEKSGTPLLVLHGLFGMLDNWAGFGREFGEMMPVHLLDLRNHGKSFHSENMSHDDLSQDIFNYMQAHNLQKVNLLGHSLGGKAVMQFAIQFPELLEKLIVVDIAPRAYAPHHQGILKALQSVEFSSIESRGEVEELLSAYIPEKSVIYFLAKSLYWDDNKKLDWRFNLKTLSEKYAEFVSKAIGSGHFSGSTLFVSGAKSNYILPEDEAAIKKQFPKASLVVIPNAGHWTQAENPVDFSAAVKEFLQK